MQDQLGFNELKKALLDLVSLDADEDLKIDLQIAVERFFVEKLTHLSKDELLEFMDSPHKMVQNFKDFIKSL